MGWNCERYRILSNMWSKGGQMIKTIKCDYCHGKNAVRFSFPGEYSWYNRGTIDPSAGFSNQYEVYVCKDCGKVMLKNVEEALEIVEKIFDAEGTPIEVGDIVYYDDDPEPFRVASFDGPEHVCLTLVKDPNSILSYTMKSSHLSHKRPILDAEGVPINVGDVVYSVPANVNDVIYFTLEKGKAYTVVCIETNGGKYLIDIAEVNGEWSIYSVSPENLTHERPDSWEKLEEDIYHLVTKGYLDRPDEDVKSIMRRAQKLALDGARRGAKEMGE